MKIRKSWGALASIGIVALVFGGAAVPALTATAATRCADSVKPSLTDPTGPNIAPVAKVTASSSLAGSNLAAVNNLALPSNPVTDTGFGWASNPADGTTSTLTMVWESAQRFNATEIFFNASEPNKNKNIHLPKTAVLEYLGEDGAYHAVPNVSGGTIQMGVKNRTVFGSLTTTSLRYVFTADRGNAVAVAEWYTNSVTPDGAPVGSAVTYRDEDFASAPILDQSKVAEVRYLDGCILAQPVTWNQADFEKQWDALKRPLSTDETIIAIGKVRISQLGTADARQTVTVQGPVVIPPVIDPGVVSIDPIILEATESSTLVLPAQAKGRDNAGAEKYYDVTWNSYDPNLLNNPGTSFVVTGYLTDYPKYVVSARIDVIAAPVPAPDFSNARVTVSPGVVAPGGEIVVSGIGFPEGVVIEVWMHSDPILLADGVNPTNGIFRNRYKIPGDTSAGKHRIEVKSGGRIVASSEFTVGVGITVDGDNKANANGAGANAKGGKGTTKGGNGKGTLSVTGSEIAQVAAAAGIVITLGAAGLIVARARRRSASTEA